MAMKMITQLIMWRVLMVTLSLQVGAVAADYLPADSAERQVLPGCKSKCGNVEIRYPFGIDDDPKCFLEVKFKLNCTDSKLYVGSVRVLNISILESQMDGAFFTSACDLEKEDVRWLYTGWLSISSKKNKFITVGRDSYGYLTIFDDDGTSYSTGCLTRIGDRKFKKGEVDGTCSGRGCCKVDIPPRVTNISIKATPFNDSTQTFSRCSYSFVVREDQYSFDRDNLQGTFPFNKSAVPVVLDWTIGNMRCNDVSKTICSYNSTCYDDEDTTMHGYRCRCKEGYEGNPYHPEGCTDINECATSTHRCVSAKNCINTPGNHTCFCPKGQSGNGTREGWCQPRNGNGTLVTILGLGLGSAGFLCLFLLGYKLYQYIQKKRQSIRKENLFRQNGGYLLQEKLSSYGNGEMAKLFTAEELQRATDNYNQSRFLGQGGYGVVYKGMLPDGTIVAVKKSKQIDRNQIETFVNEVVILSQINHRNIVKLIGCCLETETPLLVYEFIPNGTLSQHIHRKDHESLSLSWDNRLRIACEVAGAIAYMHFSASIPILHRDIKPSNILLDSNYNAKVSDFGTSRSIPIDKTHLTTAVGGTFGYMDPEYFQSSQFTDKSDVYSFGVMLVEIITGRKPITFNDEDEGQNMTALFISFMKENQLSQILDDKVVKEARKDDILAIGNLAMRCLRLNGKKRPTMKEVSAELEALRRVQSSLQVNFDHGAPSDGQPIEKMTSSDSFQESGEESILLSSQTESTSF